MGVVGRVKLRIKELIAEAGEKRRANILDGVIDCFTAVLWAEKKIPNDTEGQVNKLTENNKGCRYQH